MIWSPPVMPDRRGWAEAWRLGLVLLFGAALWIMAAGTAETEPTGRAAVMMLVVDPVLGVIATIAARYRRSRPLLTLGVTAIAGALSTIGAGPALLVLLSFAARRRWAPITLASVVSFISGFISLQLDVTLREPIGAVELVLASVIGVVVPVAIGYAVGARREVITSLLARAETAEREQEARAAAARAEERTRIAREMHDVLAHRISLIAMHAGALNFRTDLSEQDRRTAAATIEDNARVALNELREVLGLLRSTELAPDAAEAPQPGMKDLPALIAEARTLGAAVTMAEEVDGDPPEILGRTAYRIVQEALTNARKHAAGAAIRVEIAGKEGYDLVVRVGNPRPVRREQPGLPGARVGLVGVRERVEMLGGTLTTGEDANGGWLVEARLPWTP